MKNKFWNVKTEGKKSRIDLFGYVGGSKIWNDGFNEQDLLDELKAIPSENELEIAINSFGGSVFTALSIYTMLKEHKGAITFRVNGAAMSAGTIITSVPKAKVVMPKGSMMMIHKAAASVAGNADDMRKMADTVEKIEQNILDIYSEKTGKPVEEIKPYVDAETYFTASEAVAFGLADELDEETQVTNVANGDFISLNGLEVKAEKLGYHSLDFFRAATPKASAEHNPVKEEKPMTLEKLKAEHPEIVEAIRKEAMNEGIVAERSRIKAIEEIAVAGHEALVESAKFENAITAEQLAVAILKADKQAKAQMLTAIEDDASQLAGIPAVSNVGLETNAEQKQKEEAERAEVIAFGKQAFNRK